MRKLNILILTWLGNPARRRKAVEELEFRLPLFAPQHNYLIHDFDYPVTEEMKSLQYDFIYIGPTFLCFRNRPDVWQILESKYDFIRDSEAVKFAFPQDDYYCNAILDDWFCKWDIDALFSILPEQAQRFFPRFVQLDRPIVPAFTGYISEPWIKRWQTPRPAISRTIDISYRAYRAWPTVNRYAHVKASIADEFLRRYKYVKNNPLTIDVSTAPEALITGDSWHDFLENSRFCLATKSGCDHYDPYGYYKKEAEQLAISLPGLQFDMLRQKVGIDQDHLGDFTMLSPRNLEAGLAKTVQLAVPGTYNGILVANEHYIPLAEDCNNIEEVLEKMQDPDYVENLAENCKQAILAAPELRIEHHVATVIEMILANVEEKKLPNHSSQERFSKGWSDYWRFLQSKEFRASLVYPQLYPSTD